MDAAAVGASLMGFGDAIVRAAELVLLVLIMCHGVQSIINTINE